LTVSSYLFFHTLPSYLLLIQVSRYSSACVLPNTLIPHIQNITRKLLDTTTIHFKNNCLNNRVIVKCIQCKVQLIWEPNLSLTCQKLYILKYSKYNSLINHKFPQVACCNMNRNVYNIRNVVTTETHYPEESMCVKIFLGFDNNFHSLLDTTYLTHAMKDFST
jgi:hypothetical protein